MIICIVKKSEKVLRCRFLCRYAPSLLWRCREYFVVSLVEFIKLEDGCHITAPITIIRCRPDRHKCLIKHLFVAFHDKLVCSRYQLRPILLIEHFYPILAKDVASATRTHTPTLDFLWITPH